MSSITVQMSPGAGRRLTPAVAPARSHLRLTRRGRAVLLAAAVTPLIAAAVWFGLSSGVAAGDQPTGSSVTLEHVTVTPGESLWQVAQAVAPHDDPRDVVDAIIDMNGLQSSVVTPGETLAIPPQYAD